jgi:hypothetical protein
MKPPSDATLQLVPTMVPGFTSSESCT